MYVSKHAGGNRVSTAEEFLEGESAVVQRQLLSAYIEGFLQREHTGPENAEELVGRLRKLRGIHHKQNAEALTDAVLTLSRAVETREVHSAGHGEEVSRCALNIGRELGMSEQELADLAFAGRVHDVGKIVMPEKLLVKAASLSEDEYYLLKLHSSVGAQIAECIPAGPRLSEIIKHHHERFDGSGYPDGLRGEQIPLGARVLALADAYVTMTTERPFAPARTLSEAIAEIESRSGTHFDPALVTVLVRQLKGERAARAR
jgi:HD-GYP domain-containing protein (c-di-GMP phosphodiesterase class II)